jgi:hypothetical protein
MTSLAVGSLDDHHHHRLAWREVDYTSHQVFIEYNIRLEEQRPIFSSLI